MTEITDKYKDLFISESRELLTGLDANLIKLEKNIKDKVVLKELMRLSHTLKGIAATAGYGEISNLTHSFEGMVENLKNGIASGGIDILLGAVDELVRLVDVAETTDSTLEANPLVDQVGELEKEDKDKDSEILANPEKLRGISEIKVRTEKIDAVINIVAELMLNKMQLDSIGINDFELFQDALSKNNKLVEDLQYEVMQMRLTPIAQIFNRFPRMVRDLAKKLEKEIEFEMLGGDIELDREILDELGEPLVHLLRNAIDHGIEKEGKITLKATRIKNHALVEIIDNGKGIDWNKLQEKAKITEIKDKIDLLFNGISTAEEVTDISGRGVGMYAVKSGLEKVGGSIDVESETGKGTNFKLKLPVSIAIIKALIVEVENNKYAIPISDVNRLVDLTKYEISKQMDQPFTIIDEKEIPIVHLCSVLTNTKDVNKAYKKGIIVEKEKDFVCFAVDTVLTQEDIVVKTLNEKVREQISFTSVTILGEGDPVPILDLETLEIPS